jgi:ADP-ribose pyrophosphatase YjhB (NUDIX family)
MLDFSRTRIDASWYLRPSGHRDRIGAGGAVVRQAGGALLLALVKEVELGDHHYVLPKGGVEPGEDIAIAARREIAEESGLTMLTYLGELGTLARQNFKKTYWQTSHYALFQTDQVDGVITDPDNYGLAWFALENLPPLFWPDEERLLRERTRWIAERVATLD